MSGKIIILGSGTSTGIPMVGCTCTICNSNDQKDKRLRTSLLINNNNKNILIDTTPDLRSQLLQHNIDKIDAVIITHEHADHIYGMDDLRPLCFGPPIKVIPIHSSKNVAQYLTNVFPYIFQKDTRPQIGGGKPLLELDEIDSNQSSVVEKEILDENFYFFELPHGRIQSLGFIYNKIAYIPDCNDIPKEVLNFIKKQQPSILIIDCLQEAPHDTHLNVEKSLNYVSIINPVEAYLIHLNHELGHKQLEQIICDCKLTNVKVCFDGQKINF